MSNSKSTEALAAPVDKNVSYALVVEKISSGTRQIATYVANAPFIVPHVGESFETSGTAPNLSGTVSQVHHNLTHTVAGKTASANSTVWVTLK